MGRTFGRCVAAGTAAYLALGALGLIARGTGATSRGLASLSSIAVFAVLSLSVPMLVGMLGARGARAHRPRPRSVDVALVTGSAAMAGRLLGQPQLVWMLFSRPLPEAAILGIGGHVIGGLVITGVIGALSGLITFEAFLPKAPPRETNGRHLARIDRRVRPRDPAAFRFCFFAALGLELLAALGHAAVFDIDTVLIWRADTYRAVHTIERAFHWLLPVLTGVAYVVRARGHASLRAWVGAGAILGLVPHLLAAAARLGALWVASSLRGYHRHAWGVIRSFDSGFLREAAIATLLGAAAALAAALAGGERRQGPSPARAPTVLKQLNVLAACSFIAIPLVAATLFVGIGFLWQLPRLLHEAVHPGSRVVCASHALAAWLAPLFLLALFGLAGALRLGAPDTFASASWGLAACGTCGSSPIKPARTPSRSIEWARPSTRCSSGIH